MSIPSGKDFYVNRAILLEDCEDAWTPSANVTATKNTTDYQVGSASCQLDISDLFGTGLIAYEDFSAVDITKAQKIGLWIKSSAARAAGDLAIGVSETAGMGGAPVTKSLPALEANQWTFCAVSIDTAGLDAVVSVGLYAGVDLGVSTLYIDDVVALVPIGGVAEPCEPFVTADEVAEIGTGTRQLSLLKPSSVLPQINPTLILRDFDYVNSYGLISGEGAVPDHDLRWTDGKDYGVLEECKVNSVEISTRVPTEAVTAALTIWAKKLDGCTGKFSGKWAVGTKEPMTSRSVETLTIGGVDVKPYLREVSLGGENNLEAVYAGPTITPRAIIDREARYSGAMLLTREVAAQLKNVYSGSKQTIVVALKDAAGTIKTYTFTNALLRASRIPKSGLGAIFERIEWSGNMLSIT